MEFVKLIAMQVVFLFVLNSGINANPFFDYRAVQNETNELHSEANQDREDRENETILESILADQAVIWTSPLRLKGTDWLVWGSVALLTGIMIAYDEDIYGDIKEFQSGNGWVDAVSPVVTQMGDGLFNMALIGSYYLGGLLFKDDRAKDTSRLLFMTFVHTGIVSQLLKHLSGRRRPSVDNGQDGWVGPQGFFKRYTDDVSKYDAFPSGHTIVAWGSATVIASVYKEKAVIPVLSYFLASLVALSRVTEDTHWLSDVFLGAVLGYAIGRFVVRKRSRKLNVMPAIQTDGAGIGLYYTF
jgi:membrane-associated phospholipid phosphatase